MWSVQYYTCCSMCRTPQHLALKIVFSIEKIITFSYRFENYYN